MSGNHQKCFEAVTWVHYNCHTNNNLLYVFFFLPTIRRQFPVAVLVLITSEQDQDRVLWWCGGLTPYSNFHFNLPGSYCILGHTLVGACVWLAEGTSKKECSIRLQDHSFWQIFTNSAKQRNTYVPFILQIHHTGNTEKLVILLLNMSFYVEKRNAKWNGDKYRQCLHAVFNKVEIL